MLSVHSLHVVTCASVKKKLVYTQAGAVKPSHLRLDEATGPHPGGPRGQKASQERRKEGEGKGGVLIGQLKAAVEQQNRGNT